MAYTPQRMKQLALLKTIRLKECKICEALEINKIHYMTYLKWIEEDSKFRNDVEFERLRLVEGVEQHLLELSRGNNANAVKSSETFLKANNPDKFDRQKNDNQLVIQTMMLNFLAYVMKKDKELGSQLSTYQIEFLESQEKDETKKITK